MLSTTELKTLVQRHVEEGHKVGAVVGQLNSKSTDIQGFGSVTKGLAVPPDENTVFEIGSITKVFTGIALASLVVERVLRLDDPIFIFIPELEGRKAGEITLAELSTHTSGLPYFPDNLPISDTRDPWATYTESQLIEFLTYYDLPPHPVMLSWEHYSSLGVGLLGYVLSRVTGLTYGQIIKDRILSPLGMEDTGVILDDDQKQRRATPYNGLLEETSYWHPGILSGSGGINSTARDLATFLRANMFPGSTSIGAALMLAQSAQAGTAEDSIGLGWIIRKIQGKTVVLHGGTTGGFRSVISFLKNEKQGLITLTNSPGDLQCIGENGGVAYFDLDTRPDFDSSCPASGGYLRRMSFACEELDKVWRTRYKCLRFHVRKSLSCLRSSLQQRPKQADSTVTQES